MARNGAGHRSASDRNSGMMPAHAAIPYAYANHGPEKVELGGEVSKSSLGCRGGTLGESLPPGAPRTASGPAAGVVTVASRKRERKPSAPPGETRAWS